MTITPSRDWNQLSKSIGSHAEVWTLDGELLDAITFIGGITAGQSLIRERSKKRDPLPKFETSTLAAEIPELWERTIRASKGITTFTMTSAEPAQLMGHAGVSFSYEYADEDHLVRKGEARAAIIDDHLYMITYEAPRLGFFDKYVKDFREMANTATLR